MDAVDANAVKISVSKSCQESWFNYSKESNFTQVFHSILKAEDCLVSSRETSISNRDLAILAKVIVEELRAAKEILLDCCDDLRHLLVRYNKRKTAKNITMESLNRLSPGSIDVDVTVAEPRYCLCRILTLEGQLLMILYTCGSEELGEVESLSAMSSIEGAWSEAVMWTARSAEACFELGALQRFNAVNSKDLEVAEMTLIRSVDAGQRLSSSSPDKKSSNASNSCTPISLYNSKRFEIEKDFASKSYMKLLLLFAQSRRCDILDKALGKLGYQWRLHENVLNYRLAENANMKSTESSHNVEPLMVAIEESLPRSLLEHLQQVFRPNSIFWRHHGYDPFNNMSRRVGFFSYVYPFSQRNAMSSLEQVIDIIRARLAVLKVDLSEAQFAEWWVHSRPHSAGHQMHYDSDEKHMMRGGEPQHPVLTCVLYLSSGVGGPTIITNQYLSGSLGSSCWLVHCKSNRLLAFDARYLHGVIPGEGAQDISYRDTSNRAEPRRLTLMIGFWKSLSKVNDNALKQPVSFGAAFPYPPENTASKWHLDLEFRKEWSLEELNFTPESTRNDFFAISSQHQPIWDRVNPDADITKGEKYELLFQGF